MDRYDLAVIGAGPAGEAAAFAARKRGASVAVIDRDLFGGACPFFACMPSKSLLHSAAVQAAGGDYPWPKASARRDWMISREDREYPDDTRHKTDLEAAGAVAMRGSARLDGPRRVVVTHDGVDHELEAGAVILAVGSSSKIPDMPGLAEVPYWTSREATGARELPESLLILGAGPTGVELAQAYARFGVPVTVVVPGDRILPRDHPRTSAAVAAGLERDGVVIRTAGRAVRAEAGAGAGGRHRFVLEDGDTVEGAAVLLAIGRAFPLEGLGLETVGVDISSGRLAPDAGLRIAPDVYVAGDPAGPEMHTHVSHYQGEMAARIALGDDVTPDYRAIPRAVYTDPETGSVGLLLTEALARGIDAKEFTADLATSAKGYAAEAAGHVTIVVDRAAGTLVGAFIAGPGASEAIHEAVLAVKVQTPLAVLADTIHAFPTVARVLGFLFVEAAGG
ncbi:MAG: NAD(P)/FAD-dependent oxidoreductase [Chloroflexota bacterium]|nr:NAD(P)/FAD-dependent oxidoreductase [Chloroflexota bacterium]